MLVYPKSSQSLIIFFYKVEDMRGLVACTVEDICDTFKEVIGFTVTRSMLRLAETLLLVGSV